MYPLQNCKNNQPMSVVVENTTVTGFEKEEWVVPTEEVMKSWGLSKLDFAKKNESDAVSVNSDDVVLEMAPDEVYFQFRFQYPTLCHHERNEEYYAWVEAKNLEYGGNFIDMSDFVNYDDDDR